MITPMLNEFIGTVLEICTVFGGIMFIWIAVEAIGQFVSRNTDRKDKDA